MDVINADIIIIGDSATGKTSLMLRFTEKKFYESHQATIIDFRTLTTTVGDKQLKYKIWDTAGSEKYRSPMRSFYRRASGVILAYDITRRSSFESLSTWLDEIEEHCTERTPVIMLCGVKLDEKHEQGVPDTEAIMFATEHKLLHCEVSAKTGENVEFCFQQLGAEILEKPELCMDPTSDTTGPFRDQHRERGCCWTRRDT